MKFIREKYIPFIVREILKKEKPETEEDFIKFSQSLCDIVIKKELNILTLKN